MFVNTSEIVRQRCIVKILTVGLPLSKANIDERHIDSITTRTAASPVTQKPSHVILITERD